MRKFVVSLAAVGTVLAFATPAAAQYAPQPQYGAPQYGAPQGYGYGYNNYGQVRALQARIDGIQRQIENLSARRAITRDEANGLRNESRDLERRLYRVGRKGLNPNETRNIEYRVARLEQHVRHEATDGNRYGRYGYNGANGGYGEYADHGRDDRNDSDRGYQRDH